MIKAFEVNFDGLIGPTHNYAGLSYGNLASQRHGGTISNPREAAIQGLAKMKFLADLGLKQGILPPQERPDLSTLRRLGFSGCDEQVLEKAWTQSPLLTTACFSASSMWAANAATVSPSSDTADGRVHFTPANLISQFHRSLEPPTTAAILRALFPDESRFAHHAPILSAGALGDEGAANHTRLGASHPEPGLEIFVYGRDAFAATDQSPRRYPARQTREASETLARLHQLDPDRTIYVRQNPQAIDAGAFHNDVVAVGNENVLLYHADAFAEPDWVSEKIRTAFARRNAADLVLIKVPAQQVSLEEAVRSYLFNSQLVTLPSGKMSLICPMECRDAAGIVEFLDQLLQSPTPIKHVHFVDVRESMKNGGGPACLRLRVVLTEQELAAAAPGVFLTDTLYVALTNWVKRRYRDRLHGNDLRDPNLLHENRVALDELTQLLGLGSIYPFQRN